MRILALVAALLLAVPALAEAKPLSVSHPELAPVASGIAEQAVEVRCWVNDQDDPDAEPGAWGYVYLFAPVVYLSPEACIGALALLQRDFAPLWQQALGVLVLTHEAYHLKISLPLWRRSSEAQTECRAIKRIALTAQELGASPELVDGLLPWAIAEHFKVVTIDKQYGWPGCRVPVFSTFWP